MDPTYTGPITVDYTAAVMGDATNEALGLNGLTGQVCYEGNIGAPYWRVDRCPGFHWKYLYYPGPPIRSYWAVLYEVWCTGGGILATLLLTRVSGPQGFGCLNAASGITSAFVATATVTSCDPLLATVAIDLPSCANPTCYQEHGCSPEYDFQLQMTLTAP